MWFIQNLLLLGITIFALYLIFTGEKQHNQDNNPNGKNKMIAGGVIVLGLCVYGALGPDSDCYTDWDSRSNPTICE